MGSNPFNTKPAAPAAPAAAPTAAPAAAPAAAAPAAPVAAAPVAPVAPVAAAAVGTAVVEKKPRKTPNRQATKEERKYIAENYAGKSTSQIAEELGLTRQQVYRNVYEMRGKAKERLAVLEAAESTPENEAMKVKLQEVINKLPEKPWGAGGGGKKGSSVESVLDELLS